MKLADEKVVAPERELGIDPILERREPELLETRGMWLGKLLVGEVGKRGTAPECERCTAPIRRRSRIAFRQQPTALGRQLSEAFSVELVSSNLEDVSRRPRDEQLVLAARTSGLERLAQMGDIALEHVGGRLRRRCAPQPVDHLVRRKDLVWVEQE